MALNKHEILAARDTRVKVVEVPEWGGEVCIRVISGIERDSFEAAYAQEDTRNFRVRFLLAALCDHDGNRLFSAEDEELLGSKSSPVITRLFEAAWEHNSLTAEKVEELGKD